MKIPVIEDHDLVSWAAQQAAKTLAENWQDALADGTPIERLVQDVDEVCALLDDWKERVLDEARKETK